MADEVGAAFVSLVPSFANGPKVIGSELEKAFGGADKIASRAGTRAGKQFGAAFGRDKGAATAGETLQKRLAAATASAAKQVEKAREAEADATRKAAIEEKKLAELRSSGKAKASQLLAAEDRLVKAQRAMRDAAGKTAAALKGQEQQQEASRREMAEAQKETTKASRAFDTLGKKLKGLSVPKGVFKGLVGSASTAGRDAGVDFGKGFGRSAKASVDKTKGAVTGSMRSIAGAAAALFAGVQVGSFFTDANAEAREAQKVGAITAQVIKATGGAAKITAGQVGELATAISNKTGVDDEQIQAGANLLLTFKNVKREGEGLNDIFGRATGAAADLSAAGFGSVDGAAKMLGKALNDPVKGISALGRAGVTFTAEQKEQIKTLTESGDVLGAQKIIMQEVESQVGGVAAASSTAGEKMSVAFGNFKEQVGTALLPVADRFATVMTAHVIPALSSTVVWLQDKLGPVFSSFEKTAGGVFRTVTDSAKLFIGSFTGEGADVDVPFMNTIIDAGAAARSIFDTLAPVVKQIVSQVGPLLGGMINNWLGLFKQIGPAVGPFMEQIGAVVQQLLPVFQKLQGTVFKAIGDVVSKLLPVIGALISALLPALAQIGSAVGSVLDAVIPVVTQIVTALLGAIQKNMPAIQTAFATLGSIISGIGTLITTVWAAVGPVVLPIVETIFGTIVNVIGGAFQIIDGLIKVITGVLTGDFTKAGEGLKQIVGGAFQVVTAIITGARDIIGGVVGAIVGFFTTVIGRAFNFFKSAVTTVFNAVVGAVRSFWNERVKPIVNRLVQFFMITIPQAFLRFQWQARKILAAVISVIRGFWYDKVKPVVDRLVNFFKVTIPTAFGVLRTKITDILRKVRDFIRGAFDKNKGIPSIFTRAVETIGGIWAGLQELAKIPIRFIIETVINDGLIGAFNGLVGMIPVSDDQKAKWKLPDVALPPGFRHGGELPGSQSGRRDNMTVVDRYGRPRARVEPGEYIAPRWMSPLFPDLEAIRRRGRLPGYKSGGVYRPVAGGPANRHTSGYEWANWAGDFPRPAGTPVVAWKDGKVTATNRWNYSYGNHVKMRHDDGSRSLYAHLSQILTSLGATLAGGQMLGRVGTTGNSTGNHLHFEAIGASFDPNSGASSADGSGDSGFNIFDPIGEAAKLMLSGAKNTLKTAVDGALSGLGTGAMSGLLRGIPGVLIDYAFKGAESIVDLLTSSGSGSFDTGNGTARVDGNTSAITRAAAAAIGPRFGITSIGTYPGHDPSETKALDFMTSNLAQHNAIARYVWDHARALGVNYMISWNRIWNIQRDAFGNWRDYTRYGGGGSASQQHKNHVHLSFFANGTKNAPAGPAIVGENGPELVWFKGGEQVATASQTADLLKAKEITSHSFGGAAGGFSAAPSDNGWYEMRVINWETGQAMVRRVSRSESRQDAAFDRRLSRMGGQ